MRVIRGRLPNRTADRRATQLILDQVAADQRPALRVWTPARQVTFGRRDTNAPGYDRARRAAADRGFPPTERSVGGRAVAYTGSTIAFAHVVPVSDIRSNLDARYVTARDTVVTALRGLGVDAEPGEPPDSYCPGQHSVRVSDGGKLAGIAQRIRSEAALVAGCVMVCESVAVRKVLDPVYDALGVPFDPDTVTTVSDVGGPSAPDCIAQALISEFANDDRTVEHITDSSFKEC